MLHAVVEQLDESILFLLVVGLAAHDPTYELDQLVAVEIAWWHERIVANRLAPRDAVRPPRAQALAEADVFGLPDEGSPRHGLMFNHVSGDAFDLLVQVADIADLVVMPVGCPRLRNRRATD
jgi:hypothetical protein